MLSWIPYEQRMTWLPVLFSLWQDGRKGGLEQTRICIRCGSQSLLQKTLSLIRLCLPFHVVLCEGLTRYSVKLCVHILPARKWYSVSHVTLAPVCSSLIPEAGSIHRWCPLRSEPRAHQPRVLHLYWIHLISSVSPGRETL